MKLHETVDNFNKKIDAINHKLDAMDKQNKATDDKVVLMSEKINSVDKNLSFHMNEQFSDDSAGAENPISGFFNSKKNLIKKDVRDYMLKNYNIESLDDKTEGDLYDAMIDGIYELTVGRFI